MKLSAPTQIVWIISVILGVLGIIGHFVTIGIVTTLSFWLLLAGFVLLAIATLFKGL